MKKKLIKDKTFNTFCELFWDCSEEEFLKRINKLTNMDSRPDGSRGKTVFYRNGNKVGAYVWIKKRNNLGTLAHEILHLIRFWLQDFYEMDLSEETEEVYTSLHSFYFREGAKALGLKKYTL